MTDGAVVRSVAWQRRCALEHMPMAALAVRLPNWIGDCVMAQPALTALQQRGVQMVAWGQPWAPTLFAGAPFTVRALADTKPQQARQLQSCGARRCLLLTHSLSTAALARQAGLPALGYNRDGRAPLLRQRLRWPQGVHEVRRYWLLAEAMRRWQYPKTAPMCGTPPDCALRLPAPSPNASGSSASVTDIQVLVCPVATGTVAGRSKHFPDYPALVRQLREAGHQVAILAPPGQSAAMQAQFADTPVLGELSFADFMRVLAQVPVVVANDSGAMHVAAALGTEVVVPFGVTKPHWTGAWSPRLHAVGDGSAWPSCAQMAAAVARAVTASTGPDRAQAVS